MGEIYLDALRNGVVNTTNNPFYDILSKKGGGLLDEGLYSYNIDFRRGYGVRPRIGYGFRDTFMNWFNKARTFATPYLKQGLSEVADVAKNVASDVLEGKNIKSSLTNRLTEKTGELLTKASTKAPELFKTLVRKTTGSGRKRRQVSRKRKKSADSLSAKRAKYPALELM